MSEKRTMKLVTWLRKTYISL